MNTITTELDYIAAMGFTVLWLIPIVHCPFMDPISVRFDGVLPQSGTYFYRIEAGGEVATRTVSIAH